MTPIPSLDEALDELRSLAQTVEPVPGRVRLEGSELVLDNPTARGAMSVGMMVELAEAVRTLQENDVGAIVIRGATPGAFCSGGHLGQVRASLLDDGNGERMAVNMTAVLDGLLTLPAMVVALVDGPALGGGAELLTACDAVFVGPRARIGFVHGRLGVAPGWGGAARLLRAVGPRLALELLALSPVLDPMSAIEVGFARGDLQVGKDWIEAIRGMPPAAIRVMKRQLLAAGPIRRTGAEASLFAEVWGGPEHRERLGV